MQYISHVVGQQAGCIRSRLFEQVDETVVETDKVTFFAIHDWNTFDTEQELHMLTTIEERFTQSGLPTPSVQTFQFHRAFSAADYVKPLEHFRIEDHKTPEVCRL